ncbi:MerR family transcriptional regulator [Streptomyces sp. AV19]|uniref:MerR family transcriptional regulator n=1 Tax=Streptomyces sp. AV19 TaxID=2793068 RepID=UPI0018FE6473|nr:MerR family transcriptional regulator [Streptomyces sp. AV19]MBH1935273.1 MerR family transcriptional regulator [Streptomyces sp. AV19]MDG4531160.1 MerR family transcriptional regulator [Streptomyces sp. AV19]
MTASASAAGPTDRSAAGPTARSAARSTARSAAWKVGPLAEASGLTVRTLHHWDTIGLLTPSRRTAGGHREYTEDDLARLYQVLALRELGLGLETIGACLDAGVDPVRLVRDHLAEVESALTALDALRERLVCLDAELAGGSVSAATLLDALRAAGRPGPEGGRALRRHVDADGMRELADRAGALGPAAHYLLEVEWPELYRRAERLRAAGTPSADRAVRRLVDRMDELGALFTGGDAGISAGVRDAWREDPAAMSGDAAADAGEWRELAGYLDAARRGGAEGGRP